MGLSWQQGPLDTGSVGQFLTAQPLPPRLLYAEPLRSRMRVRFADRWIANSEDVVLLHEPGRYLVAYFPAADIDGDVLVTEDWVTAHQDLGATQWFTVRALQRDFAHAAWQHIALPEHAALLAGRVAFGWRAMDAFYEEDERIVGRVRCLSSHRHPLHLTSSRGATPIGWLPTHRLLALYESGFAPRWYVPRDDIDDSELKPVAGRPLGSALCGPNPLRPAPSPLTPRRWRGYHTVVETGAHTSTASPRAAPVTSATWPSRLLVSAFTDSPSTSIVSTVSGPDNDALTRWRLRLLPVRGPQATHNKLGGDGCDNRFTESRSAAAFPCRQAVRMASRAE